MGVAGEGRGAAGVAIAHGSPRPSVQLYDVLGWQSGTARVSKPSTVNVTTPAARSGISTWRRAGESNGLVATAKQQVSGLVGSAGLDWRKTRTASTSSGTSVLVSKPSHAPAVCASEARCQRAATVNRPVPPPESLWHPTAAAKVTAAATSRACRTWKCPSPTRPPACPCTAFGRYESKGKSTADRGACRAFLRVPAGRRASRQRPSAGLSRVSPTTVRLASSTVSSAGPLAGFSKAPGRDALGQPLGHTGRCRPGDLDWQTSVQRDMSSATVCASSLGSHCSLGVAIAIGIDSSHGVLGTGPSRRTRWRVGRRRCNRRRHRTPRRDTRRSRHRRESRPHERTHHHSGRGHHRPRLHRRL